MFKESTRRFKKQILQGVGVSEPRNDEEFLKYYNEYKNTTSDMKAVTKAFTKTSSSYSCFLRICSRVKYLLI